MYLIFIPFAQNSSLASWIFNGTIIAFNPFKARHQAGNRIIPTKLGHQAEHPARHPSVSSWQAEAACPHRPHATPPAATGTDPGVTPARYAGGTVPRINPSGIRKRHSHLTPAQPSEMRGNQQDSGAEGLQGQTPANYPSANKAGLQAATEEHKLF